MNIRKLEGSKRTLQAAKYPTPLVQGILNVVRKLKTRLVVLTIHEIRFILRSQRVSVRQRMKIFLVCNRKQMSIFDMHPPLQISPDQILVQRTIDRRTGVVIAEENVHNLPLEEQTRKLLG